MAFGAGADGYGTMHERLLERGAVMTSQTEIGPVFAHTEQKLTRAAMRLVAGKAFTVFYRRVHYFLFSERIVALRAERGYLCRQFPALSTQ